MSEKYQFKLPDIGEGIAEGTVGEWHVKEGDTIKKDDDLVQIENDKSVEELPSPVDGTIDKILVQPDETAEVGQVLVEMTVADGQGNISGDTATTTPANDKSATPAPKSTNNNSPVPAHADHSVPVLAMPAVRKFARDNHVALDSINGTGRHGQILKSDVEAFVKNPEPTTETTSTKPVATAAVNVTWPTHAEKMTPVRKATAKAMIKSANEIPMIHLFDEVNVDRLWDHRKKYKELAKDHGVHLTFMAYMTKALAVIMKEFPVFNATVDMDNQVINYRDYINVGIATDTERGLFVPNVKHADSRSLFNIAKQISENTVKAKDGELSADDMGHTGMSITNIGSIGGGFFTPLINWPEVAILGMGKIAPEPVVENNQVKITKVLKLSLAVDHRIIDGGTAQRAMNRLKELLADPELLLMEG